MKTSPEQSTYNSTANPNQQFLSKLPNWLKGGVAITGFVALGTFIGHELYDRIPQNATIDAPVATAYAERWQRLQKVAHWEERPRIDGYSISEVHSVDILYDKTADRDCYVAWSLPGKPEGSAVSMQCFPAK